MIFAKHAVKMLWVCFWDYALRPRVARGITRCDPSKGKRVNPKRVNPEFGLTFFGFTLLRVPELLPLSIYIYIYICIYEHEYDTESCRKSRWQDSKSKVAYFHLVHFDIYPKYQKKSTAFRPGSKAGSGQAQGCHKREVPRAGSGPKKRSFETNDFKIFSVSTKKQVSRQTNSTHPVFSKKQIVIDTIEFPTQKTNSNQC